MTGVLGLMFGGGAPGVIAAGLPSAAGAGSAQWQLNNDGSYNITGDAGGNWVSPAAAAVAANYEVKVDVTSGAFTTGTTGSYLALSSTRAWARSSPGTVVFNATIREAATGTVRGTYTGLSLVVS